MERAVTASASQCWRVICSAAVLGFLASTALSVHAQKPAANAVLAVNPSVQVAWLDTASAFQTATLGANGSITPNAKLPLRVPLGSLWKLVAYAHWVDTALPAPAYRCDGKLKDEVYCCAAGESIDRANALVASCGLYFSTQRVPWNKPWGVVMNSAPASITQAVRSKNLSETTEVDLQAWLRWLASWPTDLRVQAQADLLPYWIAGPGKSVVGDVGSMLRLKTFTIKQPDNTRWAGASGWLYAQRSVQNTPTAVWFSSAGTSAQVVPDNAARVIQLVRSQTSGEVEPYPFAAASDAASDAVSIQNANEHCVRVHYFSRYPISSIKAVGAYNSAPASGALRGRYKLIFNNGNSTVIDSAGEMTVRHGALGQDIYAELDLDEYVARVIDREAQARPAHAARALAVAARTYVLAHGRMSLGCLDIDDSSRTQRAAPRAASRGAREAATMTNGLIVRGSYAIPGQYHADQAREGVMGWHTAQLQAGQGMLFTDILLSAYPKSSLASMYSQSAVACEALVLAQQWLDTKVDAWKQQLAAHTGFFAPQSVQVCRLRSGRAHAHGGSQRIYVSGYQSLEERIALAHEYLHLAFARHPRTRDELFIETLARQLVGA